MISERKFIVFDGLDGSGKGTQISKLAGFLKEKGENVVFTREPGGAELSEDIRKVVLSDQAKDTSPLTQFLLMWAARENSIRKKVLPALIGGSHVISDRGDSSTWAFQIHGEQREELHDLFFDLRKRVFSEGAVAPSLYVFFDLPPEVALARSQSDSVRQANHFDKRGAEYHARVRRGFQSFSRNFRSVILDADRPSDEIQSELREIVLREFSR